MRQFPVFVQLREFVAMCQLVTCDVSTSRSFHNNDEKNKVGKTDDSSDFANSDSAKSNWDELKRCSQS